MGEVLRKQGYSTSGPELTHLLLDYTVKYVGEQGAAAAIANTQGDTQVLLVRAEAVGPENALEVINLVNDVLYSTEAWPDMRSCIPDVYPTPRASRARAETKPRPLCIRQTRSPALGKTLMPFEIRLDDRPFDPTIDQRDNLIQRACNLFYFPIVTSMDAMRLTVHEFARLTLDTVSVERELVTTSVSHPEAWPRDWTVKNPPDSFILVRMHARFDRLMYSQLIPIYNMTALRRQLLLVCHTFPDVLQNSVVNVTAITASPSNRRILPYLVQLSAQQHGLYDTETYLGRPVRLPESRSRTRPREQVILSLSSRSSHRIPDLKSALCILIAQIDPYHLKSWLKSSIQWSNLRFLHASTQGVMRYMIVMLLAHGDMNAYDVLGTFMVDRISNRLPHFMDLFMQPNGVMLLSDNMTYGSSDAKATEVPMTSMTEEPWEMTQRLKDMISGGRSYIGKVKSPVTSDGTNDHHDTVLTGYEPYMTEYNLTIAQRGDGGPTDDDLADIDTYEIETIMRADRVGRDYKLWIKWKDQPQITPRWRIELLMETSNPEIIADIKRVFIEAKLRADVAQGHLDEEDETLDDNTNDHYHNHADDADLTGPSQPDVSASASDLPIAMRLPLRNTRNKTVNLAQAQLVHAFLCDIAFSSLIAFQTSQCDPICA